MMVTRPGPADVTVKAGDCRRCRFLPTTLGTLPEISVPVTVYSTMPPVQLTARGSTTATVPPLVLKSGFQLTRLGDSRAELGTMRCSVAVGDLFEPFAVYAVYVHVVPGGSPVARCRVVSGTEAGALTDDLKPSAHATSMTTVAPVGTVPFR